MSKSIILFSIGLLIGIAATYFYNGIGKSQKINESAINIQKKNDIQKSDQFSDKFNRYFDTELSEFDLLNKKDIEIPISDLDILTDHSNRKVRDILNGCLDYYKNSFGRFSRMDYTSAVSFKSTELGIWIKKVLGQNPTTTTNTNVIEIRFGRYTEDFLNSVKYFPILLPNFLHRI